MLKSDEFFHSFSLALSRLFFIVIETNSLTNASKTYFSFGLICYPARCQIHSSVLFFSPKKKKQNEKRRKKIHFWIILFLFIWNGFLFFNRRSIAQDSLQYTRNEKSRYTNQSSNKLASIERHDPNRNKCHKLNDMISTDRNNLNGNLNSTNSNSDGNVMGSASVVMRERYQHPALITIMNEMQGMNFRGKQ